MNISKVISSAAAVVGGVLCVSAASAADLPTYTKAAPVVTPVINWTGFYIGGNIGGAWDNQDDPITLGAIPGSPNPLFLTTNTARFSDAASSLIGGGQIGYNRQYGSWVLGIEGDADAQSLRHGSTIVTTGSPPGFVAGDMFNSKSDWQASVRLRVGYALGPWLAYVTGGAAFTDVTLSTNFIAGASPVLFPASVASSSQTFFGGTVGAGAEYMFNRNWSLGVEGRYTGYGKESYSLGTLNIFSTASGLPTSAVTSSVNLNTWQVTGRLNYHLDWGGPMVAGY
jgi:outer membrane immunogenic protein